MFTHHFQCMRLNIDTDWFNNNKWVKVAVQFFKCNGQLCHCQSKIDRLLPAHWKKSDYTWCRDTVTLQFEPPNGKNQQSSYAKTKTQISFAVTAKLISAFVFATRIVHLLFFLNPKFQASSRLLWLYRLVCVGPGQNPNGCFSYAQAHLFFM